MKNKFALWGLLGLFGVLGLALHSTALSGLVLLFLLFLTASIPSGESFNAMLAAAGRRAFIASAITGGIVFLGAALIARSSLVRIVSFDISLLLFLYSLIGVYIIGIAVFVGGVLIGSAGLKKARR
ncbi:MAG: hypothetical protein LBQ46_09125 [Treponema sp.]|jgi:hypothetical protein|nr:hypothetical protein [Treponema sp.]